MLSTNWAPHYLAMMLVILSMLGGARVESRRCLPSLPGSDDTEDPRENSYGEQSKSWSGYPFIAKMFLDDEQFPCAGVFLDEHKVLTAAHCLFDSKCKQIDTHKLQVSTWNEKQKYSIAKVRIHKGYNCSVEKSYDDLAVMETETKMKLSKGHKIEIFEEEACKIEHDGQEPPIQVALRVFNGTEIWPKLTYKELWHVTIPECGTNHWYTGSRAQRFVHCNPWAQFPFRVELTKSGKLFGLSTSIRDTSTNLACLFYGTKSSLVLKYKDWIYEQQ